jgi:hypothetical protein
MVSPKPLSDFVPEVTLIVFPIPVSIAAQRQTIFSTRSLFVSRRENGLDSDVESEFRRKPEFVPVQSPAAF